MTPRAAVQHCLPEPTETNHMRSGVFAVSQKLIQLGFGAYFTCLLVFDIFKATKGSTDLGMRGI